MPRRNNFINITKDSVNDSKYVTSRRILSSIPNDDAPTQYRIERFVSNSAPAALSSTAYASKILSMPRRNGRTLPCSLSMIRSTKRRGYPSAKKRMVQSRLRCSQIGNLACGLGSSPISTEILIDLPLLDAHESGASEDHHAPTIFEMRYRSGPMNMSARATCFCFLQSVFYQNGDTRLADPVDIAYKWLSGLYRHEIESQMATYLGFSGRKRLVFDRQISLLVALHYPISAAQIIVVETFPAINHTSMAR
ncbi:hypothetical protein B0O99DRAFT_598587 [Bisporella sp. PMI_857]|nr:hypothetical protein B0O99DRAFT_598587 [Bisporella sp. PMI_857]